MRKPSATDTVDTLRDSLRALGLGTSGKKDTLLKRARKAFTALAVESAPAENQAAAGPLDVAPSALPARTPTLPARGYPGRFKAFLLFDAEGTCEAGGKDYDYPNEIIELPVVLLKWRPVSANSAAHELYIASSFQSYVRPTFQPKLSVFCTELTGITQETVDAAPEFKEVLERLERWMEANGLDTQRKPSEKDWLWVTDGPWDLRDFIAKQLYISRLKPANYPYLSGPSLDLKTAMKDRWSVDLIRTTPEDNITFPLDNTPSRDTLEAVASPALESSQDPLPAEALEQSPLMRMLGPDRQAPRTAGKIRHHIRGAMKLATVHQGKWLTIEGMVQRLNMGRFEGPAHSGIVDAFNMARVVIHLSQLKPALRAKMLEPNLHVQQGTKKYAWMVGDGKIDLSAVKSTSGGWVGAGAGVADQD